MVVVVFVVLVIVDVSRPCCCGGSFGDGCFLIIVLYAHISSDIVKSLSQFIIVVTVCL